VKYAFVAEFAGVRTRVRTLAFWGGDRFIDNVEYDLDGTPCEAVLQGEMCLYQDGVQARFPKDEGLVEMAAQGYIAVPLSDRSGGVLGHLALIDVKPMPMAPRDLSVFTIFAARARAELWVSPWTGFYRGVSAAFSRSASPRRGTRRRSAGRRRG
jgi:formate hydrogenlyase transcriptional activator